MNSSPPLAIAICPDACGELVDGRYRIERLLGEGGMAVVHEAVDQTNGGRVALKRLRSDLGDKRETFTRLLQQEFLELSQLQHPRIVAVYDYGIDEQRPYYTMELLDGGDLRRIAPCDYRTACALARDVCSALSLLHSRRMVYRDLSPNNVRRTSQGLAKLIDFGALVAMGPTRDMVGTLPCIAPEALNQQPLDARTDLYALGATLYFTLLRRHAFPGRSVDELITLWQHKPRAPSELVHGIPQALDRLVLDLLQLDPALRPSSAAEVMERLSAIAELPHDEQLRVEQAYLASPALVAREAQVAKLREHGEAARAGRGSSLLIQGARGVGRSRVLDAGALQGKLSGMLVLRADARDAEEGDYAAVRALAGAALREVPELAKRAAEPHVDVLSHVLPALAQVHNDVVPMPPADGAQQLRGVQAALREWLCAIARERPLLLAVDDLDKLDPPSAALIALLARESSNQPLLLLCTRDNSGETTPHASVQGALHILHRASTVLPLAPLGDVETAALLSSVFADAPNLLLLVRYVQRIAKGLPRDIMQLAQHLVSSGTVRYRDGVWLLPSKIEDGDVPASMADALRRRLDQLSTAARLLAYALCIEPNVSFTFAEMSTVVDCGDAAVQRALDALLAAELAAKSQLGFRALQPHAATPLAIVLTPEQQSSTHARLSRLFEQRHDGQRAARHAFRCGENGRGLDLLTDHAVQSVTLSDRSSESFYQVLRALPEGWLSLYDEALALCRQLGRPRRERRALLVRMAGLLAHEGGEADAFPYLRALLDELAYDAGLDLLPDATEQLDELTRIKTTLGRAHARREAALEATKGLSPGEAVPLLATTTISALGVLAYSNSFEDWQTLGQLAPLTPLSPAIQFAEQLVQAVGMRIAGRAEEALTIYQRLLAAIDSPDRQGIDVSHHVHACMRIMGAVGVLEAAMGRASCLEWSERVAKEPRYESTALLIRQLYHLFQGEMREARHVYQRLELLRLETNFHHPQEASYEFHELCAHALANDLTGVKRNTDALVRRAKYHVAYRAAWLYGCAEHQRIRGDYPTALRNVGDALALMQPRQHLLWPHAASAHVRILLDLGRAPEAAALASSYLARSEGLGYLRNVLRVALSLALSRTGHLSQAVELSELAIDQLTRSGVAGLTLGLALEARAQIAVDAGDQQTFREYAARYAALSPAANRRLRQTRAQDSAELGEASDLPSETEELEALAQLKSTLESCHTLFDRARVGLEFMGRRAGALAGVLFTRTEQGLVRTAHFGDAGRDSVVDGWATEFFKRELSEHVTEELEPKALPELIPQTQHDAPVPYTPVLLAHDDERGFAFTGVAVFVGEQVDPQRYPVRLASELSRTMLELGVVIPEYL